LTKSAAYPSAVVSREKTDSARTKSLVPVKRVVSSTTQVASRSHPAARQVTVEEPDRCGGPESETGRGDRCSDGHVVGMTGEAVGAERDHHVGIELADQPDGEVEQDPGVDAGEIAVRMVEASRPGEPELLARRLEFPLPHCSQGGPGRGAGVPDLAGSALGQRDDADLGAGARVLGQRAAGTDRLVVRMGEDPQQTRRPRARGIHRHVARHRSPSNLPLAGHEVALWIGQPIEGAPYRLVRLRRC
jgi:hypothetical protein